MWTILWGRWINLLRNYKAFLLMLILPLLFTFAFGNVGGENRISVPILDEDRSDWSQRILKELNRSQAYTFIEVDRNQLLTQVSEGRAELGIIIPGGFGSAMSQKRTAEIQLVKTKDSPLASAMEGVIRSAMQKVQFNTAILEASLQAMARIGADAGNVLLRDRIAQLAEQQWSSPPVSLSLKQLNSEERVKYDPKLQASLGFSLFFAMFTIIFSVAEILNDRQNGIWNRLIVSPMHKVQIYMGNLAYSFLTGFLQIFLLVMAGRFLFGVNWGEHWGALFFILALYIFAVSALGMLLAGFVRNTQQLNSIVPVISVSSAMLGGAYWPLEIVTSKILLSMAKLIPLYYPMSAIKEMILYGRGWEVVWVPASILLLMGILFMGLGIHLIERKAA